MIKITIGHLTFQTMENFGASGAWWAQDVGGFDGVRDEIAELLFSKEKGIGIDCYRYNLGGGSKNSGSSDFHNKNRMAECFLKNDGTYDFSRDENAVYMLRAAVKNGCEGVVLFVNSPPEFYTKNHKSCLDKPLRTNLAKKNYRNFAAYCVRCAEHFIDMGIPVTSISPVNEPVWIWTYKNGQEGCHYRPWCVRGVLRALADEIDKSEKLRANNVVISGAENGDIRWFNKTYSRIMLGDKKIKSHSDGVDVHSYFLNDHILPKFNNRLKFMARWKKYLDRKYPCAKVRVSEWTHMQGGRDSGMDSALVQARVMYEDLTVLNAVSWQHWIAVSDVDYCDGLIYINPDRSYEITKRYYAFGNFSKFVKSGAVRVEIDGGTDELKLIAFKQKNETVVIALNLSQNENELEFDGSGKAYITDENLSLCEHEFDGSFTVTPGSVTTFVTEG